MNNMDRQQYLDVAERTGWTLFELLSGDGIVTFYNNVAPHTYHANPLVWAPVLGAIIAAIKGSVASVLANNGSKSVTVIPSQSVMGSQSTMSATATPPAVSVPTSNASALTNY